MQLLPLINRSFFVGLLSLISSIGIAQDYIYKHYDPKDGLANSSVYQMLQDKDGFIWFATSGGLSRFDGTHFKTFSTQDGLPVNIILRMFEDSRGRIWLTPYKNAICYYYKGKIYNQQNDSVLRKFELEDFVRAVTENKRKELLITDSKKVYHIDAQQHVSLIDQKRLGTSLVTQLGTREWGDFYICLGKQVFSTDTKTFRHLQDIPEGKPTQHVVIHDKVTCWMNLNTLCVKSSYYKKSYKQFIGSVNTMYLVSDSILCLNTTQGTILYDLVQQKIQKQFLPNGNVSHFLVDHEGGYWFSTLNDGVFRLGSPVFKSIVGNTAAGQKLGVYSLEKFNGEIWATCDMGHLLKIRNNKASPIALTVGEEEFGNHLVYSMAIKENRLAAVCGDYVFIKQGDDKFTYQVGAGSGKDVAWKNEHELIVGSSQGIYTMPLNGTRKSIMHDGRIMCLYHRNDSTWFGTFNGLYLMNPDASIKYLGKDDSLLRAPINCIRAGLDGTIWIATYGSGLIGLQDNRIAWHFDNQNGLNSDKVRCIGIDSGFVWAGTEKDLNKVPLQPHSEITRYPYSDDLNANMVHCLLIENNIVYAGTPNGIIWFDKRDTLSSSLCNLKLLSVTVNEEEKEWQQSYSLPYRNNNIRFDFVAISMKSAGNIVYHYRLNGLDTNWKSTTQTSLELISLPPGEYKLELFAVNKFNIKSLPYSVNIVVESPFWKSTWFLVGAILLTALIAWFIGTRHNRAIIRKEKLRRLAEQQLLDLEQKALRAQMNPHFIFNCLHSIQSFILDKEPQKANKYLSQFASLIRQTLENSIQSSVLLADEIKYLSTYLQLEQMRSESGFEYSITTEATLPTSTVSIPVMVVQPFVENAVRHGVSSINGRAGLINIYFSVSDQELVCRIEDNGIGRQEAQLQKNTGPGEYRSRGMQLTYERIELINTNSVKKITVEIVDKFNELNEPNGTDVIIRLPIFATKDSTLS